jgi:ferritin-like protein
MITFILEKFTDIPKKINKEDSMGGGAYHESPDKLTKETKELHRALNSLIEELEAVNWYQQRVDVTENEELREILAHNRDEEKEHAAMVLEWIRRNDAGFAEELKTYLFTEDKVTEIEES